MIRCQINDLLKISVNYCSSQNVNLFLCHSRTSAAIHLGHLPGKVLSNYYVWKRRRERSERGRERERKRETERESECAYAFRVWVNVCVIVCVWLCVCVCDCVCDCVCVWLCVCVLQKTHYIVWSKTTCNMQHTKSIIKQKDRNFILSTKAPSSIQ